MNLHRLSDQMVPGKSVDWIGYFTAYVKNNRHDPGQPARQRAYLEALQTIPCLELVAGNFQPTRKWGMPVTCLMCKGTATEPVSFKTFEEKGSDVNLAARLVRDAALGSFSEAIIVSNDSDLKEAIRNATKDFGRQVHVWSPDVTVSNALQEVASTAQPLDVKILKKCQFPPEMVNSDGVAISRPEE